MVMELQATGLHQAVIRLQQILSICPATHTHMIAQLPSWPTLMHDQQCNAKAGEAEQPEQRCFASLWGQEDLSNIAGG